MVRSANIIYSKNNSWKRGRIQEKSDWAMYPSEFYVPFITVFLNRGLFDEENSSNFGILQFLFDKSLSS